MLGFGGEADTEGTIAAPGQAGEDVRVAHQSQQQTVVAVGVFFHFLVGDYFWAVVGHGGGSDQQVAGHGRFAGGEHVAGAGDIDPLDPVGGRQVHRAADQNHLGAGFGGRFGQGKTHFAGAVVGDVAHRVDVFLGGTCGDQHAPAGQAAALKTIGGGLRQFVGFEHAAQTHITAGLATGGRAE